MEKYIKSIKIFSFVFILSFTNPVLAQEYDDMYFTKADRKQSDFNLKANRQDAERVMSAFEDDELEEVYLDKNVNPEYIAKYQVQSSKKSSRRNQEADYFPEATSNNISSTSGYFNNYGRQSTPYETASFKINFVNTYGFAAYNNRFMFGYDPFGNVWMSDFYSPYSFNAYGYNPYDPFGYGFSRPFYSRGFNSPYYYGNIGSYSNYYCPPAYNYNSGYNSVTLAEGYQAVRRAKVIGPRGSGGSKTVVRGGIDESRSIDLNRSLRSTSVRSTSAAGDLVDQKSQNEYLDRSISNRRTNQSFTRSNAVESQSRNNTVRNASPVNRSNTIVNNERSTVIQSRSVTTQMNSERRYNTTAMPDRNDFNLPTTSGGTRNSYQNTWTQPSSGVKTNSTTAPSTSRSYTPSNNSSSGSSRSYSAPTSSGNRSSGNSSGSRSSGTSSSRSSKN
jgi:hypothetical protein|tara:strand:+ start:44 stop:1381 length:1338 start_codon:yes stop_codon:yes gene_type:complete